MTPPKRIQDGFRWFVTRRCVQREYLLNPCPFVNQLVRYLLGYHAEKLGIRVHAFCFLSNHYHIVLTDPHSHLSDFCRDFNSALAKALNAHYGRSDYVWTSGGASTQQLIESEDLVRKVVYTIANPVSSGILPHSKDWPGAQSRPEDFGSSSTTERPTTYFRKKGATTPSSVLVLDVPDGWTAEEFREEIAEALEAREEDLRDEKAARGEGFVGSRRLFLQTHKERPKSFAPKFKLRPRIACKNPARRIVELARLQDFVADYREAWVKFRDGVRDVIFPAGTYQMRIVAGVRCAEPLPEG